MLKLFIIYATPSATPQYRIFPEKLRLDLQNKLIKPLCNQMNDFFSPGSYPQVKLKQPDYLWIMYKAKKKRTTMVEEAKKAYKESKRMAIHSMGGALVLC